MYTVIVWAHDNVFPRTVGTYEETSIAIGMAIAVSIADKGDAYIKNESDGVSVGMFKNGKRIYCHIQAIEKGGN